MKVTTDTGLLTLKTDWLGVQFYCPIITLRKGVMTLSFSTTLVVRKKDWQFDWSFGFQLLGFGFGFGKLKEKNT